MYIARVLPEDSNAPAEDVTLLFPLRVVGRVGLAFEPATGSQFALPPKNPLASASGKNHHTVMDRRSSVSGNQTTSFLPPLLAGLGKAVADCACARSIYYDYKWAC